MNKGISQKIPQDAERVPKQESYLEVEVVVCGAEDGSVQVPVGEERVPDGLLAAAPVRTAVADADV